MTSVGHQSYGFPPPEVAAGVVSDRSELKLTATAFHPPLVRRRTTSCLLVSAGMPLNFRENSLVR